MKRLALPLSLIAAALLAGCGSDSDNFIEPPAAAPAPVPAPAPAPAPTNDIEFPLQAGTPQSIVIEGTGSVFSAETGLSLYYFANDEIGVSNCNGVEGDLPGGTNDAESCAGRWPPLLATEGAEPQGAYTLVERNDGTSQWAYAGYPLYTFAGDSAQGDINGNGLGGVFDLARPTPLTRDTVAERSTYVGNQVIYSVTSNNEVLEGFRQDMSGFTLYLFDVDPVNEAACYGLNGDGCINAWPPLLADSGSKPRAPLSVLTLSNGRSQWAFKGKPLYFFAGDTEAGQTNGAGLGGVWHVATVAPAIQRVVDEQSRLSATGMVYALLPNPDNNDALEPTLVDRDQYTLYTFDNDTAGVSNCEGGCAQNWPPFLATDNDVEANGFSKIERTDGTMQWAYNQQPLYFFAADTAPGEANGDGAGGVWHIVQPQTAEREQGIDD